jgi:hypothetical protein
VHEHPWDIPGRLTAHKAEHAALVHKGWCVTQTEEVGATRDTPTTHRSGCLKHPWKRFAQIAIETLIAINIDHPWLRALLERILLLVSKTRPRTVKNPDGETLQPQPLENRKRAVARPRVYNYNLGANV